MKKTKLTVDRFEGNLAVLTGEYDLEIPKDLLPEDAKEGDVLNLTFTNDEEETKSKDELARSLLNEVLKDE